MTVKYPHLVPKVAEIAELESVARIAWLQEQRWIGYPHAQKVLQRLEELYAHPRVGRMPNLLILGRSNNGKSSVVREFASRHPMEENPSGEHIIFPVLHIECPAKPTEGGLYSEILKALYEKSIPTSFEVRKSRALDAMRRIQTKILILDELHNLSVMSSNGQHQVLNALRYISNVLQISIVGCGVERLGRLMMRSDEQIGNRFPYVALPHWKCDKEFRQLLMSFERVIPLRNPSNLHNNELAKKLYAMCGGTIGELSELLNIAAAHSMSLGVDKITVEVLDSCRYVPPKDRKLELSGI